MVTGSRIYLEIIIGVPVMNPTNSSEQLACIGRSKT